MKSTNKKKLKSFCNAILISILTLLGCSTEHSNPNRRYYVGKFKLNISKSRLRSFAKDSNLYRGLTLELKENDSFYFSMDAPFIRRNIGKWTMSPIDNLYSAYLNYDTSEYGIITDGVGIGANGNGIDISMPIGNNPIGKENQDYADYLFFDRVK